jgi:beta-lactamase superfamily II metal-dependent hydrolase
MVKEIPTQGFVFWPVGTGDSTTVGIGDKVVMQVDLHNLECADEDDDPHVSIVDELVKLLPKRNKKPYLAVFVLTHPDLDHCCGFAELLDKVTIGELWFTPRIFREYTGKMCDDAVAFRKEARRRRDRTIAVGGLPEAGDRVRVFGYDELLEEDKFKGFPKDLLTVPGNTVTVVDGTDYAGTFAAFVHAPFKDDCAGERNDTSLALQITLANGKATGRALLLGDLCYPTIRKIFDITKKKEFLEWNVFQAPHHCSKSVMYWQDKGEDVAKLKQDILDDLEAAAGTPAYIVASCEPIPASNKPGDNPPHARAKARYEEIVDSGHFLCTQEHPDMDAPEPIVFRLGEVKLKYMAPEDSSSQKSEDRSRAVSAGVIAARGMDEPPQDRVGFGA